MIKVFETILIILISCTCAGQIKPFLNVKDFGARGDKNHDDTKAFQSAIDSSKGKEIYIPAGTYLIKSTLKYITKGYSQGISIIGDGETSVIKFDFANGSPLFLIDGSSMKPYQFQRGGYIRRLLITSDDKFKSKSQGDVFNITGWWMGAIEDVIITNCKGNGIVSALRPDIGSNPDSYASIGLNINSCEISFIDGVGIAQYAGIGCGAWRIIQNRIGECKGGGLIIGGNNTRIESNSIFSNGLDSVLSSGICVQRVQYNPMGTYISDNELDNNALCHILLQGSVNTIIEQNRMNSWETIFNTKGKLYPSVHVLFETSIKGSQNINTELKYNSHRSQGIRSGGSQDLELTLYDFQNDNNNADIDLVNPFIPVQDNTTRIKLINPADLKGRRIHTLLKGIVQ